MTIERTKYTGARSEKRKRRRLTWDADELMETPGAVCLFMKCTAHVPSLRGSNTGAV